MDVTADRIAELVLAARQGDQRAWEELVDAYAEMIWAITRDHRLDFEDAFDVSQITWLRLVERIDKIQQPGRVGVWLARTAQRESRRAARGRHQRLRRN